VNAPLECGGDAVLDVVRFAKVERDPKRRRRYALPVHSKFGDYRWKRPFLISPSLLQFLAAAT